MEPCLLDIMDHVLLYLSVPEAVRVASSNSLFFDKLQCNKMFWESLDFSSNSMSNGVDVALRMMKSSISRKGALIPCLNFAFCKLMNDSYLEELFHILSKQHPEKFKQLIKTINLNGCHAVTNTGLLAVARSCNSVQNLQLYCNVHITDTGVVPLIKSNGRSLVVLNLSGCRSVGDASMKALAVSCASSLTSLNLTRTSSVTDVGVMLLCGALPHLRELILYACNHLPSRTFRHLSCFNQLEHLDLCGCSVSDSDIKDIFSHCPKLEKLNLTWCTKLTDEALIHMANAGCNNLSPHMTSAVGLRVLSLHGLKAITPIGLEALISSCHRFTLTEVDVRGCILLHSSYLSDNFKGLRVAFPNEVCISFLPSKGSSSLKKNEGFFISKRLTALAPWSVLERGCHASMSVLDIQISLFQEEFFPTVPTEIPTARSICFFDFYFSYYHTVMLYIDDCT